MEKYTKYIYPDPIEDSPKESPFFLSLSNSWSRKTLNSVFTGDAKLGDILQTKSVFLLSDENDKSVTEEDLPNCLDDFDIFLEEWISKKIILHIDFLLTLRLTKKEN